MLLVAGHSLEDVSHQEAVTIIRRSYMDKTDPILKVVLLKDWQTMDQGDISIILRDFPLDFSEKYCLFDIVFVLGH